MFRSRSDHLQGAAMFLIKVTDFKICERYKKLMWLCGSITFGVCTCVLYGKVCWTAVHHTTPNRAHAHTPNVMLPHHHTNFFYIFNKF